MNTNSHEDHLHLEASEGQEEYKRPADTQHSHIEDTERGKQPLSHTPNVTINPTPKHDIVSERHVGDSHWETVDTDETVHRADARVDYRGDTAPLCQEAPEGEYVSRDSDEEAEETDGTKDVVYRWYDVGWVICCEVATYIVHPED